MDISECVKPGNRKFADRCVEQEKIDEVIEAGRFAPGGGSCQMAHFIVVKNKKILDDLAKLVQQEFSKMQIEEGMYPSISDAITLSKKGGYRFHYDPPVFIILTNQRGYVNAVADCACAVQNMIFMADALELGSCYINQLHWLDENAVIRAYLKTLEITEDETVCCALSLGYSENVSCKMSGRTGNRVTIFE